ncbi:MAG: hypothetical protein HUJ95_07015, partial [Bacteroidales bacterium]|nr:hypothetical protein [Bacteroidales bacterium]
GGVEAVDLGLSVKWASWNVGAKSETDYGQYFAWGETAEKTNYDCSNSGEYKWGIYDSSDETNYGMTKYNMTDGITNLEAGDDPATANWGSKWRSPSLDEIKELLNNCEWTWETKKDANGTDVNGYTVKSKINGNSIFLPAAGYRNGTELEYAGEYGDYWSSSLNAPRPRSAHGFNFSSGNHDWGSYYRYCGQSVRPVTK